MSRTFRNIRPIRPKVRAWNSGYDPDTLEYLAKHRRGKWSQSSLKDHIKGWKEDYQGPKLRRLHKRYVAKQRRNQGKREILNYLKGKAS